jgi:thioredoxin reductase
MSSLQEYETVIIGAGPAGLSAALVLGRCMRRVLVCDSGHYRNERSQAMHCYAGLDGIAPARFLEQARRQLEPYRNVSVRSVKVGEVTGREASFSVALISGETVAARTVLLATGVVDEVPKLEGIGDLYGRSVHVCPYCDGWEHRERPVAVYGSAEKGAGLALLLRQWTSDVVLCTDGAGQLSEDDRSRLAARQIKIVEVPIARLESRGGQLEAIQFEDGTRLTRQGLFFNTGQHPRSPILEQLGCRFEDNGGVACDEHGATSVPGVYVAGDVSRDVQLAIIAAAEGAKAALAINKHLLHADGAA